MKGILLAGGSGTRLAPLTNIISKQLLPVYDKPMICYPLATLMNLNIKEVLIISTARDIPNIESFLGNGSDYGIKISYAVQDEPNGIAEAFIIGEEFVGNDDVCLILGDNIFYGSGLNGDDVQMGKEIEKLENKEIGSLIFAYHVLDPERYGVANFDKETGEVIGIEEKPKVPKSNWAITGIYMYNSDVVEISKNLKPSARGELEITDVNNIYLQKKQLDVIKFRRGAAWLDAGTHDSLLDSASFVKTIEKRQGLKISCLEEIAYRKKWIDDNKFQELISRYREGSAYEMYLSNILKEN